MTFYVGQKVVCVDTHSPPIIDRSRAAWPTEGCIYTVSAIKISSYTGRPTIQVFELPPTCDGRAVWYQAKRFRPLVEKSTDTGMAILREILDRETITDKPPVKTKART